MARSTLQELKQELTPYMIQQELIDETDSERIGNGAYGVITKAKYCGTPCALKELHSVLLPQYKARDEAKPGGNSSQIVEKFGAEIKLLSEIRHPNFVRFIGVYFRKSSPFPVLVMELMHTSLAKCLEKYECDQQKFPLSTKLFILQDVARALVYLHSQKPPIIHRDLTASNVLLTSDMKAKLADLGVAKIIDPDLLKQLTQCPGNVVYMPPEALDEQPTYGIEIDVYSFGVLGFHIFSGKWPLHHGTLKDGKSRLSDTERCHADLIGEGSCLAKMLENCLNGNPKMRLSATNILAIINGVLTDYKMEECDFLEAQHSIVQLEKISQQLASQSDKLTSKEQDIHKLENSESNSALVIEQLKGDNKGLKSTLKLLEEKSTSLAVEVEMLKKFVTLQEEVAADTLNTVFLKESSLPCKQCPTLEKEKKDLSDFIVLLQEKITILSNEMKIKDQEVLNKKMEVELKEQEIKSLNEKVKSLETEADFKSSKNIDTAFTTSCKELSEKNTKLLETVEMLNKQLVERNERQKMVQDRYKKVIQDLLVTQKVCTLLMIVCTCIGVCVCMHSRHGVNIISNYSQLQIF